MIKIDADEFHFALSYMKSIIPDDSHMDIWRYVKVSTKDGKLTLRGMSSGKQGIITVPCIESEDNYTFVALLSKLHQLVSEYNKADDVINLDITIEDNEVSTVRMSNSFSNVKIDIALVESYPEIRFPDKGIGTVVPSEFTKLLSLANYADKQFTMFHNIHLFTRDDVLFVEATDTHCGGKGEVELSTSLNLDVAVLPDLSYILNKMKKIALSDEVWTVFLPDDINMLFVSGEYWTVGVGIHNGEYHDITNIYRNSNYNLFEIDKKSVKQAIGSIAPVIDNDKITIKIKNRKVTFECRLGKSEIDGEFDQKDNEIIVSLWNLRKIVDSVQSDNVVFQIGKNIEPLIISDNDMVYYTIPYQR